MEPRFEALINLFKDAEVAQKLLSYTPEEVARGIKAALAEETTDELTSEDLENVVGGAKGGAYYTGYYIGKAVQVAGVALTIAGGLVAIGAVSW